MRARSRLGCVGQIWRRDDQCRGRGSPGVLIIARSFVVIVYFEEAPLIWTVVVLPRLRLSNSHCAPSLALFKILMTRSTTGSDAEGAPAATAWNRASWAPM